MIHKRLPAMTILFVPMFRLVFNLFKVIIYIIQSIAHEVTDLTKGGVLPGVNYKGFIKHPT